jgi:hypothetical protein
MRQRMLVLIGLAAVTVTVTAGIALAGKDRSAPVGAWGLREANVTGPGRVSAADADLTIEGRLLIKRFKEVDAAPGDVGDWITFVGELRDGNDVIGYGTVECTLHFLQRAHCEGTFGFPGRGKVSIQGTTGPYPFSIPAVGGTDEFANHIGQISVFNPAGPEEAFVITLNKVE